jgi:hypothetical protein
LGLVAALGCGGGGLSSNNDGGGGKGGGPDAGGVDDGGTAGTLAGASGASAGAGGASAGAGGAVAGAGGATAGAGGAVAGAGGGTAGAGGATAGGGGAIGGAGGALPPLKGIHAYVVDAKITNTPVTPGGPPPPTAHTFTIVLDFDGNYARIGSAQGFGETLFNPSDGTTIELKNNLTFTFATGCGAGLTYQSMSLRPAADGTLTGTAFGTSLTVSGDIAFQGKFTATLTGLPDRVTPTLTASGGDLIDPFSPGALVASEPLPLASKPSLLSKTNETFELTPVMKNSANFIAGFTLPPVFLGYGESYTVVANGLQDFAGNISKSGPLLTTKPAPPLLAEVGFEPATAGESLGGGQVTDGTNGPVIAGARSLWAAASLTVRLPVSPGDTVVRFSYRYGANPISSASFPQMALLLGARGAPVVMTSLPADNGPRTAFPATGQPTLSLSPVLEATLKLPTGAKGEVTLARVVPNYSCGLPPPPPPGILIDDLRVE